MSLKITAFLYYDADRSQFGIVDSDIVATCEAPDCTISAHAKSVERNGPVIERIYGLDGWCLIDPILCPAHAPLPPTDPKQGP